MPDTSVPRNEVQNRAHRERSCSRADCRDNMERKDTVPRTIARNRNCENGMLPSVEAEQSYYRSHNLAGTTERVVESLCSRSSPRLSRSNCRAFSKWRGHRRDTRYRVPPPRARPHGRRLLCDVHDRARRLEHQRRKLLSALWTYTYRAVPRPNRGRTSLHVSAGSMSPLVNTSSSHNSDRVVGDASDTSRSCSTRVSRRRNVCR